MTSVEYCTEGRWVRAMASGEEVGRVVVPDIAFHWGQGLTMPLAGIADVRTDQRFRRRGIASRMMNEAVRFARDSGYGGSAVSTGSENVARRLYSGAGYVHLFSMWRFSRRIEGSCPTQTPSGFSIRPYENGDLAGVLGLIRETEAPFFGSREKAAKQWAAARSGDGGREPAPAFVAQRGGDTVGFADRFLHWQTMAAELFVRSDPEQFRLGDALVGALEVASGSVGEEDLHFWATECEDFPVRLLRNRGYRPTASRVFMFNILSLQRLLDELRDLFRNRAAGLDPRELPAEIEIVYPGERAKLELGGQAEAIRMEGPRAVVTRVVCGMLPAWEAYLMGLVDIRPGVEPHVRRACHELLPSTPFHHPVNDWW